MKLSELLHDLGCTVLRGDTDTDITGLVCDSRRVTPGCLFVAMPGARTDGHDFVPGAVKDGAAALLVEHDVPDTGSAAVIQVSDARAALSRVAAAYCGYPAKSMTMIAVTGTKGKTTTTHLLRAMLEEGGKKVGMIGTVGTFIGHEKIAEALNTTPESLELHQSFRRMAEAGCTHVVMEVSSQALKLGRVAGIDFDEAVFLNLSPDHIGGAEHKDFAEYLSCKAMLFSQCAHAVVNCDDPHCGEVMANSRCPRTTFGLGEGAQVRGTDLSPVRVPGVLGTTFQVAGFEEPLVLGIPGEHNVYDALAAIAVAQGQAISKEAIARALKTARVRGRTEVYPQSGPFTVLIDYAHNDVSFQSTLSTLKSYHPNRLIVVFGAGGDRPRMRRTDMAREAAKYADFAVITEDNPRSEQVHDICADIIGGLGSLPYVEIDDRASAIRYALDMAQEGDIVALLGKGHEEYIEVNGVRSHFSETEVLDEYFARKK